MRGDPHFAYGQASENRQESTRMSTSHEEHPLSPASSGSTGVQVHQLEPVVYRHSGHLLIPGFWCIGFCKIRGASYLRARSQNLGYGMIVFFEYAGLSPSPYPNS